MKSLAGLDRHNEAVGAALLIATPTFVLFGWLSDKIGRKRIIMAGCLLAVFTYFPVFKAITHFANPALEAAQASAPVTVVADPATCSFQFNPVGTAKFLSSCDIAKSNLVKRGIPYSNEAAPAGTHWAIGTEINLVHRLALQHPEQNVHSLQRNVCPCATMNRIDPAHLLWALENLAEGHVVNPVRVPEAVKLGARMALDRMLALPGDARSLAAALRSPEFYRVRLGIGRPTGRRDPVDWVLEDFGKREAADVELLTDVARILEMLERVEEVLALSDAGAHLIYFCDAGFGLHFRAIRRASTAYRNGA